MTMGIRETRKALARAINAKDIDGIKTFIHPSIRQTDENGQLLEGTIDESLKQTQRMFSSVSEFEHIVRIEDIQIEGDTARLATHIFNRELRRGFQCKGFLGSELTDHQYEGWSRQMETWNIIDGRWIMTAVQFQTVNSGNLPRPANESIMDHKTLPREPTQEAQTVNMLPRQPGSEEEPMA